MPMVAAKRPMSSETMARVGEPGETKIAQERPSTTSQKYSKDENFSAISASAGDAVTSTRVPKSPPSEEKTSTAPRASSERPLRVIR